MDQLNLMSMSTAGILLFHMLVSISTLCNQRKMYLLRSDVKRGRRNEAWISYNSSTHNLSVAFSGFRNNSVVMQGLDYQVDLRQHLPEFVTFGFSMATGVDFAIFSIYSWEFNSSLEMDDETTNPVSNPKSRRKNITALVVGLSLGGEFLVGGVVLIIWLAGNRYITYQMEKNRGLTDAYRTQFTSLHTIVAVGHQSMKLGVLEVLLRVVIWKYQTGLRSAGPTHYIGL